MSEKIYNAIVVGSGAAGSFAAKELTQRGLEVLLLEAGSDISEEDFQVSSHEKKAKGVDVFPRLLAGLRGQHIQARLTFFRDQIKHLFVNDRENPYSTHPENFYLWIRGRQLGGRLHTWGRVFLRMSDYDFMAASRDGIGEDWPISYTDLKPYYEAVETFLGVYGSRENLPNLPDGNYEKPSHLNTMEQVFKARVEERWPDRSVIPWRYVSPNLKRIPRPILAARETGPVDDPNGRCRKKHHHRPNDWKDRRCDMCRQKHQTAVKLFSRCRRSLCLHYRIDSSIAEFGMPETSQWCRQFHRSAWQVFHGPVPECPVRIRAGPKRLGI